jgi:DNA mismatch repair protein MutS
MTLHAGARGTGPVEVRAEDPRGTPAMQQYARCKAQHPGCVLFFRIGDFYEMFDDDAQLAHRVLGITLTRRQAGIPMAGVPHHAVETYLRRMLEAGYRVAVCDQVQDAAEARGLIERAVTRVVTPGTLVDEGLLDEGKPNRVAALDLRGGGPAVLAAVELSTGWFRLYDVPPERLADELALVAPSELLYPEGPPGAGGPGGGEPPAAVRDLPGCALTPRPAWTFRAAEAADALREHFGVASLAGFGLDDDDPAIPAAGAVLRYLSQTQAPGEDVGRRRLSHLAPPRREPAQRYVVLDAATLSNLEIERTMRGGSAAGSLLAVFGRPRSGMGKRRLREWLCYPLRDIDAIEARHRAVAALVEDRALAERLGAELAAVQDVARIVGRICTGRGGPRDLAALGASTARLPALAALLEARPPFAESLDRLRPIAAPLAGLAERIARTCVEEPPVTVRDGGVIRDGVDAALDEARGLQRDAASWLARYQKDLVEQTGIGSLKVGYNRVFGYYIEITHVHAARIPPAFARRQTLKNAERYVTPELREFEDRVTRASADALDRERALFDALVAAAAAEAAPIAGFAEVVADLDVLLAFADAARRFNYCRPQMAREPVLDIVQGRHPVLDRSLGERFVPNDCRLGRSGDGAPGATLALITGPNMAGKSTCIRQAALIVLLAHAGSFVPADSAVVGLTDRIFTRIGAGDELHAGRSTFMVEMTEAANILHHATAASLVVLDELGRGTSTLDGLALAWAIAESLAARGCRTLFATHYHELTALGDGDPAVTNLHVAVREWGEEIIFVYRILPGRSDRSYGIHVARLAGIPPATIARASALLETLAVHTAPGPRSPPAQLSLFTEYLEHPAVKELAALDLDTMTPMSAFDALRRLRDLAR